MLIKATILGCAAIVSTPICYATLQDSQDLSKPAVIEESKQEAALRAKIRKLEAALEKLEVLNVDAQREAGEARVALGRLRARLESCMDLLEGSVRRVRSRNCTPSRSRKLLTYYQWMQENGEPKRAERMMDRVIKETGKRNSSLNSLAWHLLTERGTAGQFDQAALALARRMEKNGHLRHNELDTVALAKFLNGKVVEAVAMQKRAIKASGSSSEYRRRLRVYEAAMKSTMPVTSNPAVAGGQ